MVMLDNVLYAVRLALFLLSHYEFVFFVVLPTPGWRPGLFGPLLEESPRSS